MMKRLAVAALAALTLTGCGATETPQAVGGQTDQPAATTPTEQATPSEEPTPAPTLDTLTFTISGQTAEGVQADSTIEIAPKFYTPDEVFNNFPEYSTALTACSYDDQRDGVILGSVQTIAQNGGFEASVGTNIFFYPPEGDPKWDSEVPADMMEGVSSREQSILGWEYGFAYSEPECTSRNIWQDTQYPRLAAAAGIQAGEDTTDWGPVKFAFIVPGWRSPAHPKGNKAYKRAFSHVSFCIANGGPKSITSGGVRYYTCAGTLAGGEGEAGSPKGPGKSKNPAGGVWFDFMN